MIKVYRLIMLWLTCGLISCANQPLAPLSPEISIANFRLSNLGILQQDFLVQLRLKNPNPFPLPITRLDYILSINNQEFNRGDSQQSLILPALSEETLEIKVSSNLWKIIDQWRGWESGFSRQLNYQLSGGLQITNWVPKLPFNYQGTVALNWSK